MLTKIQELALIARCIAGDDRNAYGHLVKAYADDIRRMLDRLTSGDSALVDDLAQETFVKGYLSLRSFKGVSRFRTWLFRIAYNEFVNHTRCSRRILEVGIDSVEQVCGDDDEDESIIDSDRIAEAIDKLSPTMKAVIQLYYYEGFTVARISVILQMPQGTVKSYLHRARTKLALTLEKYENC